MIETLIPAEQVSTQPPIIPTPPKPNQRWLWLVLIIVLLIGVILWVLISNNTNTDTSSAVANTVSSTEAPDNSSINPAGNQAGEETATTTTTPSTATGSTTGWKTYQSSRFGYQIMYPSQASYSELENGMQQYGQDGKKGYIVDFIGMTLSIRIDSTDNTRQDKTLEQLVETRNNVGMTIYIGGTPSVVSTNGQRAFQYVSNTAKGEAQGVNTVVLGDNYYYQIEATVMTAANPEQPLTKEQRDFYDLFVSTFKVSN